MCQRLSNPLPASHCNQPWKSVQHCHEDNTGEKDTRQDGSKNPVWIREYPEQKSHVKLGKDDDPAGALHQAVTGLQPSQRHGT
jgi:hypothetical protein